MLCVLSLWIAPGLIEIMPPHHLSVLLVVLGFLFNLGMCLPYIKACPVA